MKKTGGLIALLLWGIYVPCSALTLGDIRVQVRRLINDKADPKLKFTNEEILSYINETQRDVVNQTWCLTNRTSQALSANTTYYSLPNDLIAVTYVDFVDYTGRVRELTEVSEKGKRQDSPDYERIIGPPMEYLVRDSTTSGALPRQVAFLPIASTTTTLGTARIDYIQQATDLATATDVPFDGARVLYPYHYALVYGTSAKLKAIKGDPSADTDMKMYLAYIALMKDRLGQMPNYAPGTSPGNGR